MKTKKNVFQWGGARFRVVLATLMVFSLLGVNTSSARAAVGKPDLDITAVTITDMSDNPITQAYVGQTVKVKITVDNIGGDDYESCTDLGETPGVNCTVDEIYRDVYVGTAPGFPACHAGNTPWDDTETTLIMAADAPSTRTIEVTFDSGDAGNIQLYTYVDVNCSVDEAGDTHPTASNVNNSFGPINFTVIGSPGVGVYDNTDTGWTYTGTWNSFTGLTGPTNGTLHRGDAVGSKASFTFSGTQFILKYTQNTNRGNIGVYVDGNLVTTINANGALQFQRTYTSPIFSFGDHTVEFVHAGGAPGTVIDVDSIQILTTPGVGVYDNAVSGWTYTGTWNAFTGLTGPTNGTLHRGDAVGSKASFTFTGTQFILTYTQNTNRGNIGVYVDGNLVTTINANGALQFQRTYTSPIFSSGVHTVEFVHAGGAGTVIDVDSIQIP